MGGNQANQQNQLKITVQTMGMQTANSWTRESVTGNNYLANGGTELNATTQLYDLEFRNYDPALGRMFQVDPVAAKYASLTPYNYSFNNPIAFADPSGADPDPDYQNPNHQYYFHNGAGSAGYPGLTYDDVVPQSARGEFNSAFGWRQDVMLGWFAGGGQSLNAGSFAYQARLYAYQDRLHKAQAMAGAVTDALNGPDGETYMTVSGGRITSRDFKSTLQLQREWGSEIARGYYGGDGRMPLTQDLSPYPPTIDMRARFLNSVSTELFDRLKGVTDPRRIENLIQTTGEGHFKDDRSIPYAPIGNAPHPWASEKFIYIAGYTVKAMDMSGNVAFRFTSNVADNFYLTRRFEGDHFYWETQGYGAPDYFFEYTTANLTVSIQVIYYTYAPNN